MKHVVKFLLSFAKFMAKARGDIEAACSLYKRALAVDGENPVVLGSYAHFLAHEGEGSKKEAERLFKKSLKINPNGAQVMLWYAKLLKRIGRSGQVKHFYSGLT